MVGIGKYQIVGGDGAKPDVQLRGAVRHAAEDSDTRQRVTLWAVEPGEVAEQCLADARAVARIGDVGLARLLESGTAKEGDLAGQLYWVTALDGGEWLGERLGRDGKLPVGAAVRFARHAASALAKAHAAHVAHLTLTPASLRIVRDEEVEGGERIQVHDFGLGRLTEAHRALDPIGRADDPRALAYVAPEQCKTKGAVDERADLYSLGCVLFEMLAGEPPFAGEPVELVGKHQFVPAPSLHERDPRIPLEVSRLVASLLEKDPAQRPPSMDAVAAALKLAPASAAPEVLRSRPTPPVSGGNRRLGLALIGVGALGVIALAVFLVTRTNNSVSHPPQQDDDKPRGARASSTVSAGVPTKPALAPQRNGPHWAIRKTALPIEIDGKGTDAAWKLAPSIELPAGDFWGQLKTDAHVRLLWDDTNVYALFDVKDGDIESGSAPDEGGRCKQDCMEINLLFPTTAATGMVSVSIDPKGNVKDGFGWEGDENLQWASQSVAKVAVQGTVDDPSDTDQGFTVEVAIPLASVQHDAPPVPGSHLEVWVRRFDQLARQQSKFVPLPMAVLADSNGEWPQLNPQRRYSLPRGMSLTQHDSKDAVATLYLVADLGSSDFPTLAQGSEQLFAHYGDKLRIVWRPVAYPKNAEARPAALIACAAQKQEKLPAVMAAALAAATTAAPTTDGVWRKAAETAGLDMARLSDDAEGPDCRASWEEGQRGFERFGWFEPPVVFMNDRPYPLPESGNWLLTDLETLANGGSPARTSQSADKLASEPWNPDSFVTNNITFARPPLERPANVTRTPSGVTWMSARAGDTAKPTPTPNSRVTIAYAAWDKDKILFSSSAASWVGTVESNVSELLPGLSEMVVDMHPGEARRVWLSEPTELTVDIILIDSKPAGTP
ncbi:MAG: protein kinase [Polyangiaceae bacterium]